MGEERDKEGQGPGFKVSDRRKRYDESAVEATPPATEAPPPAPPASEPAASGPVGATAGHDLHGDAEAQGLPGPADFLQLIAKLYQEGLAFMGLFDDPQAGHSMANLPVASWHIDILGLLEEKTKGNLTEEEAKLLKDAIANLKVTFVRASGYIKH